MKHVIFMFMGVCLLGYVHMPYSLAEGDATVRGKIIIDGKQFKFYDETEESIQAFLREAALKNGCTFNFTQFAVIWAIFQIFCMPSRRVANGWI